MDEPGMEIFQYAPLKSFVHPTFWYKLAEVKLDIDRLSDGPRNVFAYYTNYKSKDNLIEIDYSAFNSDFQPPQHNLTYYGTLYIKNVPDDFRNCNKLDLLISEGAKIQKDIDSGAAIQNPCLLNRFILLTYPNLKAHKFYYWFAFPVPSEPNARVQEDLKPVKVSGDFSKELANIYSSLTTQKEKSYFVIRREGTNLKYFQLKDIISDNLEDNFKNIDLDDVFFCFSDSSEFEHPSWQLRNYIYLLFLKCPNLRGNAAQFLGVRFKAFNDCSDSLIWKAFVPAKAKEFNIPEMPPWIGWEANKYGKVSGQCADMADSMDPKVLAENSINLNLKLMKWRLVPDLDLDIIANTKCLLLGAGTLGCAVARCLMGWGVKTITFIDNGKVTFSNPVRQCLYTHDDATGDKSKAEVAAKRLREINPNATTNGISLQIPMPGHYVGKALRESTNKDLICIENQIKNHDVIFLLTDSRESRWLPTLLGAFHKKIVISAALGFDSYLVIRHGSHKDSNNQKPAVDIGDLKCISGSELGCYFCNDITAPGDSMKGRTLDQQCTVTRPGISNIAASYAVELLAALLQHEDKDLAPAYFYSLAACTQEIPEGLLGILPHSIRGSLTTFSNILPATTKFPQCVACSKKVLEEYKQRGYEMLFNVFDTNKYLEDLTGITQLKLSEKQITDIEEFDNWSE